MVARFSYRTPFLSAGYMEGEESAPLPIEVEIEDWGLDSLGHAEWRRQGDYTRHVFLLRDLEPINQEARDMRAAALAAEALARDREEPVSWPQARGHDLDRIADDLMGIQRRPGETDDSLRQRLSNSRRRTA